MYVLVDYGIRIVLLLNKSVDLLSDQFSTCSTYLYVHWLCEPMYHIPISAIRLPFQFTSLF
jgi:hypothetical protein